MTPPISPAQPSSRGVSASADFPITPPGFRPAHSMPVDSRLRQPIFAALALLLASPALYAQHLVFTTVTPGTSPVWVSSPEQSKDFGFQTLQILNDSDNPISSVHLKVTFSVSDSPEEVVDSGHIYVSLDPGEEKRLDVFLGRVEALSQKLRSMHEPVAWVKITVESVEFADGSRWDANAPKVIEDPPPVVAPAK